jgi:hypothetical protein
MFVDAKLFWKGTHLLVPVETLEELERYKQTLKWKCSREEVVNDVTFFTDQLDEIANALFDFQLETASYSRRVSQMSVLQKIANRSFDSMAPEMLLHIWCGNIINLIEFECITQDDATGWLVMRGLTPIPQQPASQKICVVCSVNCKLKCPKCFTFYCSTEHQKQDWKFHKKTCCRFQPKKVK